MSGNEKYHPNTFKPDKVDVFGVSDKFRISAHPRWEFNKDLAAWFAKRAEGEVLHLCCGNTNFDFALNVDTDEDSAADELADMFELPKEWEGQFDTIISDPPYQLAYDKRALWVRNLLKVVKKRQGSRILLKLDFIPYFGPTWDLKELVVYQGKRYWAHVSLLLNYEFVDPTLDEFV